MSKHSAHFLHRAAIEHRLFAGMFTPVAKPWANQNAAASNESCFLLSSHSFSLQLALEKAHHPFLELHIFWVGKLPHETTKVYCNHSLPAAPALGTKLAHSTPHGLCQGSGILLQRSAEPRAMLGKQRSLCSRQGGCHFWDPGQRAKGVCNLQQPPPPPTKSKRQPM